MQALRQARLDLGRILDNCDGCDHQRGGASNNNANLKVCRSCTNFRAMQKQRELIEDLQAINRRGGIVSR